MSEARLVECDTHGTSPPAYVCQHLLKSLQDRKPVGIQWLYDANNHVNAWCDACETYLQAHGDEWNDETEGFAKIRLICQGCFEVLTTFNETKDLN